MRKCKITVQKTLYFKDLAERYPPHEKGPCDFLKEGDVFYTAGPHGVDIPEGFCPPAWAAIAQYAHVLAAGGKVYNRDEVHLTACPDGMRPVIFLMEPYED
ncbi:TIGR04076 family protein [Sporobacter termitidis DSM 10068]|uniref:TIGR04076 family protein n=1 Tax=Sporobacter termitidis DSM 10068 TaxID=1123282 RepID=A0A1M5YTK0_9FIRM|nr:TIGR04076 family protein [Sporobacter termitidis]SHI15160.1 TIGR04076 family protein [Sporobacter termitidis DSM 10068]